jgi:adenosylmethionine-8-amino-7-oxononanoate aminotransferase
MVAAIQEQAASLTFVHRAQFRNRPAEELGRLVAEKAGPSYGPSMFVGSGSEANELALKFAVMFWAARGRPEKSRFASTSLSYHGNTIGGLNLSGQPRYSAAFGSLVHPGQTVRSPQAYRLAVPSGSTPAAVLVERLRGDFARLDLATTAAVVTVGVGGSATGVCVPPAAWVEELRRLCDEHDVLWICDEVMSGFGRVGRWFAFQDSAARPDLITFGKGVSGGYVGLGGVTLARPVWDVVRSRYPAMPGGHTFTNTPLACAVGVAAIGVLEDEGLVGRARDRGAQLGAELMALAERSRTVGDVRGQGFLWGLELVADRSTGTPFGPALDATGIFAGLAVAQRMHVYPSRFPIDGRHGDAVIIAPPLTSDEAELAELMRRLELTLAAFDVWATSASSG